MIRILQGSDTSLFDVEGIQNVHGSLKSTIQNMNLTLAPHYSSHEQWHFRNESFTIPTSRNPNLFCKLFDRL